MLIIDFPEIFLKILEKIPMFLSFFVGFFKDYKTL